MILIYRSHVTALRKTDNVSVFMSTKQKEDGDQHHEEVVIQWRMKVWYQQVALVALSRVFSSHHLSQSVVQLVQRIAAGSLLLWRHNTGGTTSNYQMDCRDTSYQHSWFPEDESYRLWWFLEFLCSAIPTWHPNIQYVQDKLPDCVMRPDSAKKTCGAETKVRFIKRRVENMKTGGRKENSVTLYFTGQ